MTFLDNHEEQTKEGHGAGGKAPAVTADLYHRPRNVNVQRRGSEEGAPQKKSEVT